jgi:hypothetical protein
MNDLKPGMYQLRVDIQNPAADRRKRNDWTAADTLEVGARFYLRSFASSPEYAPEFVVLGKYGSVASFTPLGKLILWAADPVEPTVEESLLIRDVWPRDVLVWLIQNDALTLAQVETVQKTLEDELEAKEGGR